MGYESEMAKITIPIVLKRFTNDDDCTLATAGYLTDTFGGGTATVAQLIGAPATTNGPGNRRSSPTGSMNLILR